MRVIAGTARRMKLVTPEGMDTRPTQDIIKETLFNMIQFEVPGAVFVDLCAGSGQMGIEALSRGASCAVFVEKDRKTQELILENLEFTKLTEGASLIRGDVNSVLGRLGTEKFDVIFMDPPFNHGLEKETLTILSGLDILEEDGLIVVEASPKTDFSYLDELGFEKFKERRYGMSQHIFLKKIRG